MSAKAVNEATGKNLLNKFLSDVAEPCVFATVTEETNLGTLEQEFPWLTTKVRTFIVLYCPLTQIGVILK